MKGFPQIFALLCALVLLIGCGVGEIEEDERGAFVTPIVAWGEELTQEQVRIEHHVGYGDVANMVLIRLEVTNIPDEYEGQRFTLLGGGAGDTGVHGLNSTGFRGTGYHFASPRNSNTPYRTRTPDYEADFTRPVTNGRLVYDVYYEPTDLSELGDGFSDEMDIALQIVRAGTSDPVLRGPEELDQRWAVGGVDIGDTAHLTISVTEAAPDDAGVPVEGDLAEDEEASVE